MKSSRQITGTPLSFDCGGRRAPEIAADSTPRRTALFALALLFLCAGFKANATTYSVTTCTDTMPDASGSPAGAGDGPGVSGDLRFSILQANSAGGTNTITRRVPLAAR
jgi:hypothetical protein